MKNIGKAFSAILAMLLFVSCVIGATVCVKNLVENENFGISLLGASVLPCVAVYILYLMWEDQKVDVHEFRLICTYDIIDGETTNHRYNVQQKRVHVITKKISWCNRTDHQEEGLSKIHLEKYRSKEMPFDNKYGVTKVIDPA
jgi:hypothetical protein